jgi:hypothetical protein
MQGPSLPVEWLLASEELCYIIVSAIVLFDMSMKPKCCVEIQNSVTNNHDFNSLLQIVICMCTFHEFINIYLQNISLKTRVHSVSDVNKESSSIYIP